MTTQFIKHEVEHEAELHEVTESNKAVEKALEDVPYKGPYSAGVEWLKARIEELEAEVACEEKRFSMAHEMIAELSAQNAVYHSAIKRIVKVNHYDFSGYKIAAKALALPNVSTEILRKRDAKVLRDAANELRYGIREDASEQLRQMADELEVGK